MKTSGSRSIGTNSRNLSLTIVIQWHKTFFQINTENRTPKSCYSVIKTTMWWLNRLRIVSTFKQLTEIPCCIEIIRAEMINRNIIEKMAWTPFPYLTSWPFLVAGVIYSKRQSHGSHGHMNSITLTRSHTCTHAHFFPWDCCCAQLSY